MLQETRAISLLIRNGRIVTAVDDYHADLFIERDRVTLIGENLQVQADQVLDASNRIVIPGGVDPHTHLDMPMGDLVSCDDFFTGTCAAAFGGTTTIIDFPTQARGQSPFAALDAWHAKAEGKACIDYGFHMILTDVPEERLPELTRLADQEGITSFKLFMAYPSTLYVDDATLYRVFRQAGEDGCVICMHAENGIVIDEIVRRTLRDGNTAPKYHALTRPTQMEAEGVFRSIAIAEVANVPLYIVHLSSAAALEQVKLARDRALPVHAETCPQYLFLDDSLYDRPGFEAAKWVMTPALREQWNQETLWKGLQFNDLQAIATDHCPFCMAGQKDRGMTDFSKIPNGAPGIENRMSLIYNGGVVQRRISLNRFVQLTSTNAAKMFGLFPRKGTIAVGSDADLVIFDPNRTETISIHNPLMHHMNVDYSVYEGMQVQGYVETTIVRGQVITHKGDFVGHPGYGEYLKRDRYSGFNL